MHRTKGGACNQRRSLPNTPTSLVEEVGLRWLSLLNTNK